MKKIFLNSICLAIIFSASLSTLEAQNAPEFGTVPNEERPELKSVVTVDNTTKETESLKDKTYTGRNPDEAVLLIKDGAKAKLLNSILNKAAGDVSNGGQSNFYGLNAVAVAQDGSSILLKDVTIISSAEGANAVFSTGTGSVVTIKNIKIHTTKNSSRGLDSTYGGLIIADNVEVTTEGEHCAAFATDRGEGTVTVNGGTANTSGKGSPVIYSTGNISVKNLTGKATGSEIAVIEGKNSILIQDSVLQGNGTQGVMLYQSMSGDANEGVSTFTSKDSTLQSTSHGPFFYITNTESVMNLSNTKLVYASDVLIKCSGNNSERGWGRQGVNGGSVTVNAVNQNLEGRIICDSISSIDLNLGKNTVLKGAINSSNEGTVNLALSKKAKFILTGNCYVNKLTVENMEFTNIKTNGYKIYYSKDEIENSYLDGRTISFSDGGKIIGIKSDNKINSNKEINNCKPNDKKNRAPEKMPDMISLTGIIKILGTTPNTYVALVSSDGNEYKLQAMEQPDFNKGKGNGPKNNPPKNKMPKGKEPPKTVKIEELISLENSNVTLTGIFMKNDKNKNQEKPIQDDNSIQNKELNENNFIVFSYEKK